MAAQDVQSHDPDDFEDREEAPRSLFEAMWFRVVVVVLAIGAVAAVSVPIVIDSVDPSPPGPTIARAPAAQKPRPDARPAVAMAAAGPAPTVAAPALTPVTAVIEKAPTATSAKTERPRQLAQAPKAEPVKPEAKPEAPKARATTTTPATAATGELWIQVGAYREAATVKRVSTALKDKGFSVSESTLTRGGAAPDGAATAGGDRYDVVVSGGLPAEVSRKLSAKGLSADPVSEGTVVRPSLALRDAVALSNDLRAEGLSVSVRRVAKAGPAPAASAPGAEMLHRVRVGPFPDRAAADAAVQKLRDLGYTPFIARGGP